jgi:hypothetical protein
VQEWRQHKVAIWLIAVTAGLELVILVIGVVYHYQHFR